MTPRRLLVVPYFYPPFSGSGNRWPTLARYLRRAGHEVTVVATDAYGRLADDDELDIVRVRDLRSLEPLRRLLGRGSAAELGGSHAEVPPGPLLTKVLVPDAHVAGWVPAALVRLRAILSQSAYDVLITS